METDLGKISQALKEHKYIDENIGNITNNLSDINALVLLERERSGLALSSQEAFSAKLELLQKNLDYLSTNLKKHFLLEENTLPKLVGITLMQSLLQEHTAINLEFEKINFSLKDFKPEGLELKILLDKKMEIINMVNHLCRLIQEHAFKEDKILRTMLKNTRGQDKE